MIRVFPPIRVFASAALALLLTGPGWAAAPPAHKAALPTVLLIPASSGDVAALVDLRTRLRLGGHVAVLTYDPESAAIQRAAADDAHLEWLLNAPATDRGRMQLARALQASFYAVVSPGRMADTTRVELVETAPAARTFDWTGTNREFGVHAMESQVADSISHPANYDLVANDPTPAAPAAGPSSAPVASILTRPVPVAAVPAEPVPAEPVPIAAAPAPVAPAPVAPAPIAPVAVAAVPADLVSSVPNAPSPALPVPVAASPVPTAPIAPVSVSAVTAAVPEGPRPLVKSAPILLELPVQVASGIDIPPITPPILTPVLPRPVPIPAAPVMTAVPLPKAARTAPSPQLMAAVPVPRLVPVPLPALVLPRMMAIPPLPTLPPPTKIAALPKREVLTPALPPPFLPVPIIVKPLVRPTPAAVKKPTPKAEDMTAIEPLLAKGDSILDGGDAVGAIALYREAVNGAPRSVTPRLKLAQAYQKDGLNDRALDEARRALEIAPDSVPVQQFLAEMDQQTGTSAGTLVRDRAALERDPSSPNAHAALADALWNNGDLGGAEAEYKAASALAPEGSRLGTAQLAQLYAAEARYGDCLAMLQTGGSGSYATAIQIVKNRTDTLSSTLAASRTTFAGHQSTREQFYDDAKKLSAQAQALAGFVAQITPPDQYKLSHLHRMLSTNLLAQETATLVSYIETGDSRQSDSIASLERGTATEMLTAQATEEKLGLWKKQPRDN